MCRCCRQYWTGGLEFGEVSLWSQVWIPGPGTDLGWESVTVVLDAASIPPSIWIHRTGVMCMFRVLGLHATLEIDKEKDWTANDPALCEHGMKKEQRKTATTVFQSVPAFIHTHTSSSCTLILFFFFCFCSKCISALRYVVPTRVSNLALVLGLLLFTCKTSILGSLLCFQIFFFGVTTQSISSNQLL